MFVLSLFVGPLFILLALRFSTWDVQGTETCSSDSHPNDVCLVPESQKWIRKYLLYDVNHGEGFNLRRDVYMRIASLVKNLRKEENEDWVLVLPPWGPLYHWQSKDLGLQSKIPWAAFFDLPSLSKYVPVIEFQDYLNEHGPQIEELYYLQHYAEGWKDGKWEESMDIGNCNDPPVYEKVDGRYYGWFWGFQNIYALTFNCLSVQGFSSTLKPFLVKRAKASRSIMIDRAEVILHDMFGDANYWRARRSMRFAKHLCDIGNQFRAEYLNSTDVQDHIVMTEDWRDMRSEVGSATGGPYLSVHLRRKDFVQARESEVPSLRHAADQINKKLQELSLTTVFVATDAPESEFQELKSYLPNVVRFRPTPEIHRKYKDGGVAIIDQWICAHARYFTGTYESTFSFRIQEEREILGFHPDMTFNRLCGGNQTTCQQPSKWRIVYE